MKWYLSVKAVNSNQYDGVSDDDISDDEISRDEISAARFWRCFVFIFLLF